MKPSDLLLDFGRPVAYYPGLVRYMGSPHAVIFFGQIFYWQDKTDSALGVYKSQEDIRRETGLTFSQQNTARKQLVARGILIETPKRLEHKVYYRVDCKKLDELITAESDISDAEKHQFPEIRKSISGEQDLHFGTAKSGVRGAVNPRFDLTEITTENTKDLNPPLTPPGGGDSPKSKFDPLSARPENVSESVWKEWVIYRTEIKKPLTKTMCSQQARKLAGHPDPDSVLCNSIANGWQGIFPDKVTGGRRTPKNNADSVHWNSPEAWENTI
ncbi:hypothetical protein [Morganella morganii]|uniref:hypothetical protein n=1 Tax=Morganella morganii TaxID=582 RepID=UPI00339C204C